MNYQLRYRYPCRSRISPITRQVDKRTSGVDVGHIAEHFGF